MEGESFDLQDLLKEAASLKEEIQKLEAALSPLKESFSEVSENVLRALETMDLESVRAHGFNFYKEHKASISVPKTKEAKEALFKFLEEKGLFWESVNVHSQTLNALYKSLSEEAAKEGVLDYRIPGIDDAMPYTVLRMRKESK